MPPIRAPIASLVLTQPSAVMFTLPMQVLDDLREAMARGPVEVAAFDQNNRRLLSTGTLLLIDNIIDQATATIRLKAMFANDDERLWPGEFVNARVLIEIRQQRHRGSDHRGPARRQGPVRVVVNDGQQGRAAPDRGRPGVGRPHDRSTTGLAEGDRVVTDGQYKLRSTHASRSSPSPTAAARRDSAAMNLSEPFIRRPVATSLIMAAVGVRSASRRFRSCRSRRCRRSISRPSGDGDARGRQRRDHGVLGRRAAGAPVRPDRRRHPDDLGRVRSA